eukprot:CAMPEP_0172301240 /NCGR_PEP_ID=MMETSP1058-20130122/3170_1 /TAXON_ID=83371 /ORGANISM="Detonula confervacea, Strain CCMP 353" /LENGTH=231 /DNA_ID=CAMNT_0013011287 /DNA_START=61 /DNA_END=756 /DNA_ORIENTATION=+
MTWTRKANFFLAAIALASAAVDAFVAPTAAVAQRITPITLQESTSVAEEGESIQSFLQQNYPLFETLLLAQIPNIYGTLSASDSTDGFTIFCPSNKIMEDIDSKRKVQISDPRNVEVTEKLASYHVLANGKVTQERLKREDWTVPKIDGVAALSIGGVLTLGGELRVGRSKTGGFMGWGATEDGGVVIGNNEARIVKSTCVGDKGIVHEVDGFVAPDLIWRYFDQLRIPGF